MICINPGKSKPTSHTFCIINDRGLLFTSGGLHTMALRSPRGVSEIKRIVTHNPDGANRGEEGCLKMVYRFKW